MTKAAHQKMRASPLLRSALLATLGLLAGCASDGPATGIAGHAAAVPQRAGCSVTLKADVPTRLIGDNVVFDARINGRPVVVEADTGTSAAAVLHIDAGRAAELGLAMAQAGDSVSTLSGTLEVDTATSNQIRVGDAVIDDLPILVPKTRGPRTLIPGDGVLGIEFLHHFDLEFDPQAQRIRLFEVTGCGDALVPFAEPYTEMPMRPGPGSTPLIPVRLDGVALPAMVDTGAEASLVTKSGARLAGVGERDLSRNQVIPGAVCDAQGALIDVCVHEFDSFEINDLRVTDVPIPVLLADRPYAMYVGRDLLMGQRILISFATGKLYASRLPVH